MTARQVRDMLITSIKDDDTWADHELYFEFDRPAFESIYVPVTGVKVLNSLPVYGTQPTLPVIVITNK